MKKGSNHKAFAPSGRQVRVYVPTKEEAEACDGETEIEVRRAFRDKTALNPDERLRLAAAMRFDRMAFALGAGCNE